MLGIGVLEMLIVLVPLQFVVTPGNVPSLVPKPATATAVVVTNCEAIAFVNPELGGKVSLGCRVGLKPGDSATAVTAELVAAGKRTPMKAWAYARYLLQSGHQSGLTFTARGVPPGIYEAVVTVSYKPLQGEAGTVVAKQLVTVP